MKGAKKRWAINRKLKVNSCRFFRQNDDEKYEISMVDYVEREISHLIRKFNWKIPLCPDSPRSLYRRLPFDMFFEVTSWTNIFIIEKLRHDEKLNCLCLRNSRQSFRLLFFVWTLIHPALQHLHCCYLQTSTSIFTGARLLKYCAHGSRVLPL